MDFDQVCMGVHKAMGFKGVVRIYGLYPTIRDEGQREKCVVWER